jgi:aminoglycoside phosphotransferase
MTAVPGRHVTADSDDLLQTVHSIGQGLAQLHGVPSTNCPFDESPQTRLQRTKQAIDQNLIDASQFDDRNSGLTPSMIYERLLRTIPAYDDIVVVHGDATLSNMLIGPNGGLGFVDCGNSGRSDRYVDLALVQEELLNEFGRDAAECLVAAYGLRCWDGRKAAFFKDLYELF